LATKHLKKCFSHTKKSQVNGTKIVFFYGNGKFSCINETLVAAGNDLMSATKFYFLSLILELLKKVLFLSATPG